MSCAVGLSRFYAATRGLLAPRKRQSHQTDQNDAEGLALTMRAETKAQTSASATAALDTPVWRRVGRSTSFAARCGGRGPTHLVDPGAADKLASSA